MKVLNILAGSLVLGFGGSYLICILADSLLGRDVAMFVAVPPAILLGMHSRRLVEKFMGYTLYEAMQGDDKNG